MPNMYSVNTMALTVHLPVESALKVRRYAKILGISRASALVRIIEEHPCMNPDLSEAECQEAEAIVQKNRDRRAHARSK